MGAKDEGVKFVMQSVIAIDAFFVLAAIVGACMDSSNSLVLFKKGKID